jgi:hypothetical protein
MASIGFSTRTYQSLDILEFAYTPPYHNKIVLHQKYVDEGPSIRQIAAEFLPSKEAVRVALIAAGHLLSSKICINNSSLKSPPNTLL